jgi:hypothetical protein
VVTFNSQHQGCQPTHKALPTTVYPVAVVQYPVVDGMGTTPASSRSLSAESEEYRLHGLESGRRHDLMFLLRQLFSFMSRMIWL